MKKNKFNKGDLVSIRDRHDGLMYGIVFAVDNTPLTKVRWSNHRAIQTLGGQYNECLKLEQKAKQ
jgi:hypothetical protein